jgi:DNA-binding transcriptional LysR family regulator
LAKRPLRRIIGPFVIAQSTPMRQPNLSDVALFAAVVEAGGFRVAAQRRGMSASSLSDCVRRLEKELDVRLLNRTTRGLTPTEIGARLLERLRPALDEINTALNDLQEDPQNPVGSLRLHVPGVIARHILPQLLDGFLARYPGIALEVNMDNTFIDVIGAGYDAGIRYEESLAKDMIAIPIGPRRQCFMAVAAPSYLQRHGTPQHPSELSEHRLLGYRFASGKLGVWEFEQEGRTLRIAPEGRLVSSSQDLLIAAACAGHGILYTFEEYIAAPLASGQLQPILQDWWQHFEGPYLYYHSRRHVPAPLRAFVDYVKALNDSGHPSPSPK